MPLVWTGPVTPGSVSMDVAQDYDMISESQLTQANGEAWWAVPNTNGATFRHVKARNFDIPIPGGGAQVRTILFSVEMWIKCTFIGGGCKPQLVGTHINDSYSPNMGTNSHSTEWDYRWTDGGFGDLWGIPGLTPTEIDWLLGDSSTDGLDFWFSPSGISLTGDLLIRNLTLDVQYEILGNNTIMMAK
jgi:hypothetical protein